MKNKDVYCGNIERRVAMVQDINEMKKPMRTKIGYGLGTACDTIPYTLFGTYFLFFMTDVAGIPAAIAGVISSIAIISQVVAGPIAGYLSDNSMNPKGRRRPIMIKTAIPFAIIAALLFNPIEASLGIKIAYYATLGILFLICYAVYFNVWTALGAEMTRDYKERNSLRSIVAYAAIPFQLIATSGVIAMVGLFSGNGLPVGRSWFYSVAVLAVLMALGAIICHRSTTEDHHVYTEEEIAAIKASRFSPKSMIADYISFFKVKLFRRIVLFSLIFVSGFIMMNNGIVYIMVNCLGLSEAKQSLFWTINAILAIVAIPIIFGVANKWDKKKAMMLFVGVYVVSSTVWFVMGMITTITFTSYILFAGCVCLGSCAFYSLLYSLMYDCCDVYTLATGEEKQGGMMALQALSQTAGAAIASLLLGMGLQLFGYTDAASVTEFTAKGIWSLGTIFPAIFVAISMIFLAKYNLTRKDFDEVKKAINDRKEGKEIDMSKFKHLI